METHSIHMINDEGQKISLVKCSQLGIQLPYSLHTDAKGLLLIGCSTYQNASKGANIHVLEMK